MKQRDTTLDCIKGILILFLLLYHTIDISKLWLGVSSSYLLSFEVGQFLVTSSWMSIFFIVTGICSNFDIDVKTYIIKTLKGIYLPTLFFAILSAVIKSVCLSDFSPIRGLISLHNLSTCFDLWFIAALLISKTLYYFIQKSKCKKYYLQSLYFFFTALGALSHEYNLPNYFYHQQALLMLPMLYIGQLIREYKALVYRKILFVLGILYPILLFFLRYYHIHIPKNVAVVSLTWEELPLYCIVCTFGFCFYYMIAYTIRNALLSYIGKQTLAIYCMNFVFIEFTLRALYNIISIDSYPSTLLVIAVTTAVSGYLGILISEGYKRLTFTVECLTSHKG